MALQSNPWRKRLLQFRVEDGKAKAKKRSVFSECCVLFPAVIRFPPPCPKTWSNNHSKLIHTKNTGASHSGNYCTLSPKLNIQETSGRPYHTSSSPKFHPRSPKKDWYEVIKMCFTISAAGRRKNRLFVSAQLIYLPSPAGDKLFYFPLPPTTLLNSGAVGFVTTRTGVVYPQVGNTTLAEHRTLVSLFGYKDLQRPCL